MCEEGLMPQAALAFSQKQKKLTSPVSFFYVGFTGPLRARSRPARSAGPASSSGCSRAKRPVKAGILNAASHAVLVAQKAQRVRLDHRPGFGKAFLLISVQCVVPAVESFLHGFRGAGGKAGVFCPLQQGCRCDHRFERAAGNTRPPAQTRLNKASQQKFWCKYARKPLTPATLYKLGIINSAPRSCKAVVSLAARRTVRTKPPVAPASDCISVTCGQSLVRKILFIFGSPFIYTFPGITE